MNQMTMNWQKVIPTRCLLRLRKTDRKYVSKKIRTGGCAHTSATTPISLPSSPLQACTSHTDQNTSDPVPQRA